MTTKQGSFNAIRAVSPRPVPPAAIGAKPAIMAVGLQGEDLLRAGGAEQTVVLGIAPVLGDKRVGVRRVFVLGAKGFVGFAFGFFRFLKPALLFALLFLLFPLPLLCGAGSEPGPEMPVHDKAACQEAKRESNQDASPVGGELLEDAADVNVKHRQPTVVTLDIISLLQLLVLVSIALRLPNKRE